jgi:hypothetical protein
MTNKMATEKSIFNNLNFSKNKIKILLLNKSFMKTGLSIKGRLSMEKGRGWGNKFGQMELNMSAPGIMIT